jgi:hypothetical protein
VSLKKQKNSCWDIRLLLKNTKDVTVKDRNGTILHAFLASSEIFTNGITVMFYDFQDLIVTTKQRLNSTLQTFMVTPQFYSNAQIIVII